MRHTALKIMEPPPQAHCPSADIHAWTDCPFPPADTHAMYTFLTILARLFEAPARLHGIQAPRPIPVRRDQ